MLIVGFEPAQVKPNIFEVCLLNHTDISTMRSEERFNTGWHIISLSVDTKYNIDTMV